MKIHHVGYLTKNLAKSREQFIKLGYVTEQECRLDEIRQINIEFMVNGGYRVELIEPVSKTSPMYPLLKHYRNTPYHFCYCTDDMEAAVKQLEADRYLVIDPPETAPCIGGRRVVFLMHKDMGIIELVEESEE